MEGTWFVTGVYGHLDTNCRRETWEVIRSCARREGVAWLVFGDFNEVLHHYEKKGGRLRTEMQLSEFRNVLMDCALKDMGFSAPQFIWCNRKGEGGTVSERLDRFLATS